MQQRGWTYRLSDSAVSQTDKYQYDITHMWNPKRNDTNELVYKTEADSQISKSNLWLLEGKGVCVGGIN